MSANTASASEKQKPRFRIPIPFWAQVLLGLVVGLVLGYVARTYDVSWLATTLDKVGGIFIQLLKLAVAPLVFFAILVSITNLRKVNNAARLASRTLLWFMITSLIAVVIGLAIGLITNPGNGSNLTPADGSKPDHMRLLAGLPDRHRPDRCRHAVHRAQRPADRLHGGRGRCRHPEDRSEGPADPLPVRVGARTAAEGPVVGHPARPDRLRRNFIGRAIVQYGWDLLGNYATFTIDIYVGCALVLFGVYPLLLATVAKLNPLQFFKGAWPAIQLAFVSRSSVGTMPVTQQSAERLGVPRNYASFAVPFGATTKMDGCAAIYPAISAIFVAQIFDVQLGIKEYLLIAFVSVIGSAATAGLTGATVMLTLTLSTLGLPMEGVGLLLAIDPILDMMRTATNVAGQALVPVIVAARENILDRVKYDRATASPVEELVAESQHEDEPQAVGAAA